MKFNFFRRYWLLISLVFCQSLSASEDVLNSVVTPKEINTKTVVINMVQNGYRLSIANFKTQLPAESILEFYREQWQIPVAEGLPGYVEEIAGDWSIISRPQGDWNQVVQIRKAGNGIEGRISVMELKRAPGKPLSIAMPGNASLVSSTAAKDFGHESNTYVIYSKSGIKTVSNFYRNHFDGAGWRRVFDKLTNKSQVMLLQRTGERAELVVSRSPNGGSLIIINKVEDDG